MTGPALIAGTVPVGPMLSMFDPIFVGINEFGLPHYTRVIYKNLLAAGEPGGGKSGLLNTLAAHAALSAHSRTVLFDAKQVELGMWDDIADEFVGPDMTKALITLLRLQKVMDNRNAWLAAHRRRKIEPGDGLNVITSIFDEIAVYATVLGTEQEQRLFVSLLRDLVARGRNVAMPVIAATQRPSVDIIPKSLRDLFGYRAAFRCTSTGSSDIILGDGWSSAGITATDISPSNPGECLLIAEGGVPERVKVSYLSDADIIALADYAAWTRRTGSPPHRRPGHRRRLNPPPRKGTRHVLHHRPQRPPGLHHRPARPGRLPGQPPRHRRPRTRHRDPPARRQRRRRRMRPGRPLRPPARRPRRERAWPTTATTGLPGPSARSATG